MAWRWWKSFEFGPLRTTLSNRGIGWNIGTSFLRFGVGPSGAQYILVRIPGTGIGFIKYLGQPFQRQYCDRANQKWVQIGGVDQIVTEPALSPGPIFSTTGKSSRPAEVM